MSAGSVSGMEYETDSLLRIFDDLLQTYEVQINERQQRIDELKNKSDRESQSVSELYNLNQQFYNEYRPYISDSAIYYQKKNILLAQETGNLNLIFNSKLQLAYFLASIGLYKESVDMLDEIKETDLPPDLLIDYYKCMMHTYGELSFYSKENELSNRYRQTANKYKDLLISILSPNEDSYLDILESDYRNVRDFTMALKMNDERLKSTPQNTQKFALIAFLRSLTYKESGDVQMQQYWLLKSAIADLQLGITDNASSWELANIRYKMSDIKRAHKYINYSVNNSTIFNARLRFTQIAEVQSIINKAYLTNKAQQEKKMRILLIFISLLTLLLLTSVI